MSGMGDLTLFLPEAVVLLAALVAFAMSAFARSYRAVWYATTFMSLAAVAVCIASMGFHGEPFFPGIYRVDLFSQLLKLGLTIGLALTLLVSRELPSVRASAHSDLPIFLTLGTLGMMMLVSATELLTLYVVLELSAYALYVMAALNRRQREGGEAGVKYLLFGAAASAITLYGLSLIYGAVGSTLLTDVVNHESSALLVLGVILTLSGLFFKLAVLPFHAWAPDTYQAAPHQVATFIGTSSKVAAIGILVRVLTMALDADAVQTLLIALSVVSMTVGNLAALAQKDLKRMLAWSTVAHAGYALLGMLTLSELGMASAIFYGLTYFVIAFAAFLAVVAVSPEGENPSLDSLKGLYRRAPLVGIVLLAGMFGLAGVPPTPGFTGKWFLFSAALESDYFWLVLVGAINATISLYYYLRVVRYAYQTVPDGHDSRPLKVDFPTQLAGWAAMGLIVFVGFYPGPLWDLARDAAKVLLAGG
ncbi:MAG: NADH-quinone oxidoreductase subunit N [Deltaproteobacteria bacterium HGW-Deltaproteobacteria-14]|nr:MAG: NADH-quinone oxidoreductase subunit N [Deltaproteobacteria bacterium HGW-Deltaproteobacteria-14]